jgi:Rieske Fe-S protein
VEEDRLDTATALMKKAEEKGVCIHLPSDSVIADKFAADKIKELTEIAPGEGRIIKHDGHVLALYKDNLHEVHLLNPVCTHLRCNVAWNSSEKSWDCPCHGARYSIEGNVLTGPARHNLEKVNVASAPADQKIS